MHISAKDLHFHPSPRIEKYQGTDNVSLSLSCANVDPVRPDASHQWTRKDTDTDRGKETKGEGDGKKERSRERDCRNSLQHRKDGFGLLKTIFPECGLEVEVRVRASNKMCVRLERGHEPAGLHDKSQNSMEMGQTFTSTIFTRTSTSNNAQPEMYQQSAALADQPAKSKYCV